MALRSIFTEQLWKWLQFDFRNRHGIDQGIATKTADIKSHCEMINGFSLPSQSNRCLRKNFYRSGCFDGVAAHVGT
eukprot:4715270-Amphidinium_carterae.1